MNKDEMLAAEIEKIKRFAVTLEDKCSQGDVRAIEVWNRLSERFAALMGFVSPRQLLINEDAVDLALKAARIELDARESSPAQPEKLAELSAKRDAVLGAKIAQCRRDGVTWDQIGKTFGISTSTANDLYMSHLKSLDTSEGSGD